MIPLHHLKLFVLLIEQPLPFWDDLYRLAAILWILFWIGECDRLFQNLLTVIFVCEVENHLGIRKTTVWELFTKNFEITF